MKKTRIEVEVALVDLNTGQLDWLPANPRQWTRDDLERTTESIKRDPDFLEDRPLLLTPNGERFVVFGGNLRSRGCVHAEKKTSPAYVYIPETEEDYMTIKRRAMLDNGQFGSWDYDALANDEWSDMPLTDWGVPAWNPNEGDDDDENGGGDSQKPEKSDEVEKLLNDAMRENVRETMDQIRVGMEHGFLATFLTRGLAQAKFIRAKYYGEHYPQWMSLYFCPERFWTSANTCSPGEQMRAIAEGETDAGIAGLRTLSGDHLLLLLLKGSYPFGGARMPMDFPANKARELIEEFSEGRGARILDPCHGWGGRLCGAMMADVAEYVGIDPSPEAHRGVEREAEAFAAYSPDTRVELIQQPFEDVNLEGRTFDMALTSPPYFDVEQYHGEGQSHERYPKYDKWVRGFYEPLISKTFAALKDGGVFCLQVGSQSYPLLDDGKRIAQEVGFIVEDVRPLGGGTHSALHGNDDETEENEKILILRKPNE